MDSDKESSAEDAANKIAHGPEIPLEPPVKPIWKNYKWMIPIWLGILGLVWLGVVLGVDKRVLAGVVFLLGLFSNAFAWLVGIIALVPIIGPLIAKALSLSIIWLLNALGYLVSFVAIRRGYSKDVMTYRGLTVALIVGIVIGYVIGKYV
jgi:hypothetical protein